MLSAIRSPRCELRATAAVSLIVACFAFSKKLMVEHVICVQSTYHMSEYHMINAVTKLQ